MDSVIEVTGRKSKVTVTFDTQKEGGEPKNGNPEMRDGNNGLSSFKFHGNVEEERITTHYLVVSVLQEKRNEQLVLRPRTPQQRRSSSLMMMVRRHIMPGLISSSVILIHLFNILF